MKFKGLIILIATFTFYTCIDPYKPELKGYDSLLVVDGLITDANSSYSVKLTRTLQNQNNEPANVADAIVFITDDAGRNISLINRNNGLYKTDSVEFKGMVGGTYVLHIITSDGKEFESDPCLMNPVSEIDSIYYEPDQEAINNGTQNETGLRIYLDSKGNTKDSYYRWDFEETWKFKVPSPTRARYINEDSVIMIPTVREYCWKRIKSGNILIHSFYDGQTGTIRKNPVFFIATGKSDRLLIQYSILVNQYSISKKEYDYWDNLKKINDNVGDIFAKQPFTVISNMHNLSAPNERVLGYFQVSAVKQKRKYILFSEIVGLDLPLFRYPCVRIEKEPKDYPTGFAPPVTWDELYGMFCKYADYYFVEPKFYPGTTTLNKLVFARPECANCELSGTSVKPEFWVDMN